VSRNINSIFNDNDNNVYRVPCTPILIELQDECVEMHNNCNFYNSDGSDNKEEDFGEDNNCGHLQSPQVGQKHTWSLSTPDCTTCNVIKVQEGKGKPKTEDWELAVQDIIPEAILSYENQLVLEIPYYPDHMQEMVWAKAAWQDGCCECEVKIHHNGKLHKIVRTHYIL
jgi:hypothetical protein